MMRYVKGVLIIAGLMIMAMPMAAAQNQEEVGPGLIGPGSPIYGLEVAWDNAAVDIGLKRAGQVAQERAAEAGRAAERNRPEAASRAARNLQNVAEKARDEEDEEGIQRAMNSLRGSMDDLEQQMQNASNEEARQGMQTALDNMQGAIENMEQAQQQRDEARRNESGVDAPGPGDIPEGNDSISQNLTDEERMDDAGRLQEQARQDLSDGRDAMNDGDLGTASSEFGEASQKFGEAIDLIEELDTAEAGNMTERLQEARTTAEEARSQVEQNLESVENTTQGGVQ